MELGKSVQRAAFSSYFLVDKELAMPENNEKKKIFKSLTKLFEPQRKFVYDGKLAHHSQIPIYIGFSLSDTLNELPGLLTAAQIILFMAQCSTLKPLYYNTIYVLPSSQSSSLDPKLKANCNFSCVVLLFTDWALKAEPLVGRILPLQQMELWAPAGASQDAAAPSQQPGNVCWCLGCSSGDHISLLSWGIGNFGQGESPK